MKNHFRHLLALLILGLCGLIGWWVGRDLDKSVVKPAKFHQTPVVKATKPSLRPLRAAKPDRFSDGTTVEIFTSRRPEQVILRFPSSDTYHSFLIALLDSDVELIDQIDRLRAVRIGYEEWSDLVRLLDGEDITTYDSLPTVPTPSPTTENGQQGLVGFGHNMLSWLGVPNDHSHWGAGVKIAVLDTGVVPHTALPGLTDSIAITAFPADLSKTHGHGTAVASLIASNDTYAPGVAPAAEIISIRVSDDTGKADAFDLAAGILAAIDQDVEIINCSMGTTENNPLIEEAVNYAHDSGVLIVAASGNSEQAEACYPAAYPSVISVGAVDARAEHLDFSNYGTFLSLTAPGFALNAAWPGNRFATISGTSASAPIVSGAIAATMSNGRGKTMSASQAAEIVIANADEAGIPGPDSEYGFGILNMARVMNRGVNGIIDAAITNQRIFKSNSPSISDEVQVTLQNRGTVMLVNTLLEVRTPLGTRQFNASMLAPGAIQTFSLPVRLRGLTEDQPIQVESMITLGTSGTDVTPHNNQRSEMLIGR